MVFKREGIRPCFKSHFVGHQCECWKTSGFWKKEYFWNCHHLDAPYGRFSASMGMVIKKKKKKDSGFALSNRIVFHFILSCFQIWRRKRTYLSSESEDRYHSWKVFNAIIRYTWGTRCSHCWELWFKCSILGGFGFFLSSSFAVVVIKFQVLAFSLVVIPSPYSAAEVRYKEWG